MSRNQRLQLRNTVTSRSEAGAYLRSPGDAVLVERGVPRWLLIACPCGCGAEIPINLDARAGKAWRLYRNAKWGLSLFPSVWRDTDCRSHFIVWRDSMLFGFRDDDLESPGAASETSRLAQTVHARLPASGYVPFVELADALGEIPWDVLHALRHLVRQGLAGEGIGKAQGTFCRTPGASKSTESGGWWA